LLGVTAEALSANIN